MSQPGAADAARAMFAGDVASRSLGMELVRSAPGSAVVRMRITPEMVNGHGIAHGGYLFLLADSAFAFACNGHGPATVAAKVHVAYGYGCSPAASARTTARNSSGAP